MQAATQEAPSDALKSVWRKPSGSTTPQVPKAFVIVDVEGRAEQALPLTEALPEPLKKK